MLIDLQNAIVGRDTKPYAASEVIERSRMMAEGFRAKGTLVVYVRVRLNEILALPADETMKPPKDLPAAASEIAEAAGMQSGDLLINKRH